MTIFLCLSNKIHCQLSKRSDVEKSIEDNEHIVNTHISSGSSSDEQEHQQTAREEGEKRTRRRKGIAERQENGRLKESAGFPLDVKAPIEAVAQRAYTPDNDGSRGNASDVVRRYYPLETNRIFVKSETHFLLVNSSFSSKPLFFSPLSFSFFKEISILTTS